MEPCGCKIIFYGLMSDMGGEIKFCPLHAAAPEVVMAQAPVVEAEAQPTIGTVDEAPMPRRKEKA